MIEMRFFVRIRGALTPPPRIDDPVMNIPLETVSDCSIGSFPDSLRTMLRRPPTGLYTALYRYRPRHMVIFRQALGQSEAG